MGVIDIGGACINRTGNTNLHPFTDYSFLQLSNPANESGILDALCVYAYSAITGFKVGTFYLVSGTTYHCRDVYTVGNLAEGENNEAISLEVVTGDCIGFFGDSGKIERAFSSQAGRKVSGNKLIKDLETNFTSLVNDLWSCYGTGDVAVEGGAGAGLLNILTSPLLI